MQNDRCSFLSLVQMLRQASAGQAKVAGHQHVGEGIVPPMVIRSRERKRVRGERRCRGAGLVGRRQVRSPFLSALDSPAPSSDAARGTGARGSQTNSVKTKAERRGPNPLYYFIPLEIPRKMGSVIRHHNPYRFADGAHRIRYCRLSGADDEYCICYCTKCIQKF